MPNTPLVSVIMPVFNAGIFVNTAIKSLLNQTLEDIEVVLVNDASTDNSLDIIKSYSKKDSRITVINSKTNIGAGKARNLGLKAVKGKYLTFMDADDYIEPDVYKNAFLLADKSGADEVVWGLTEEHYNRFGKHTKSLVITPKTKVCTSLKSKMESILRLEAQTIFGYLWNSLYKTEIIVNNNIDFENAFLYEDFFFNLRVAKKVKTFATLDNNGYHYFKRKNNSITNQFCKNYYDLSCRRIEEMLDFFEASGEVNPMTYNILGERFLRYTLSAICRNFSKQSNMDWTDKKEWFLKSCDAPLCKKLLLSYHPVSPVYQILKHCLLSKKPFNALLLGRTISVIK